MKYATTETFKNNVTNTWGDIGENWLAELPTIIEFLANHWHLTHIIPVSNLSYNFVALANQNQQAVVLKISCDKQLIKDEYNALKHFNGHGTIKVIDVNKEYNALLLEQAVPGYLLKEHYPRRIEDTIQIYAAVVEAISAVSLGKSNFTHVSKWCKAVDRIADERIEKHFVERAEELRDFLLKTARNEYLCHGDLHLENIIQQDLNWISIDPKGIIGEMAFEAAAFDLLSKNELKDCATISNKIIYRVSLLSNNLSLDYDRLLSWIFLRTIISAQWFVEDNGDPSDDLILATHFYPLLK